MHIWSSGLEHRPLSIPFVSPNESNRLWSPVRIRYYNELHCFKKALSITRTPRKTHMTTSCAMAYKTACPSSKTYVGKSKLRKVGVRANGDHKKTFCLFVILSFAVIKNICLFVICISKIIFVFFDICNYKIFVFLPVLKKLNVVIISFFRWIFSCSTFFWFVN